MDDRNTTFAHADQPAFEQMQIDHNISRIAIFFVCFLTVGVFYFTLVNLPLARMLPIQQVQQFGQTIQALNPTARTTPVASAKPTGALGGSQISTSSSASASPSASAFAGAPPASAVAETSASAAAGTAAKPSASSASGQSYQVESGDTLTSIARKFNTNAQAIADANKMTVNAPLRVGQTITIPK
ncbi:MAG: LysM peptidoglycan-binding domain-containing protein [Chloroflexi bacterium]|nr:LysM peptidoglycan-binding domain-containing protein [Chloroflexota bacterium]